MIDRGILAWEMAQTMYDEPLDDLHADDKNVALEVAGNMLDAVLAYLADHADELSGMAVARHPFGKGPVSTPKTVIEHAIAALQEALVL